MSACRTCCQCQGIERLFGKQAGLERRNMRRVALWQMVVYTRP
jgi:hypothetical protein